MDYVKRRPRCRAVKVTEATTADDLDGWDNVMVPAPGTVLYGTESGSYLPVPHGHYLVEERGQRYTAPADAFEADWAPVEDD